MKMISRLLLAVLLTLLLAATASAQSLFPLGNVWTVGDSKIYGVTDVPGSCGPRDPMWSALNAEGGAFVGTLSGGADGLGGNLTPCPISGLALLSDGHSGYHCSDVTNDTPGWAVSTPRVAIVHVATNDLIAQVTGVPGWNMDKFYVDYDVMLRTLLAKFPTITWLVSNMDPMPNLVGFANFYPVNEYIHQEVFKYRRQGYSIYFVNAFGSCGMGAPGDYNAGGIHELTPGYAKKGNCFLHTLQTLQPRSSRYRNRRPSLVRLRRSPCSTL